MAAKVVESGKSALVELVKVVVLFGVLFGTIAWAKQAPDTFQAVMTKIGDTAASLIIWICDQIQNALPPPSSGSG